MRVFRVFIALFFALTTYAQTTPPAPSPAPSFDVAELKINNSGDAKSHCDLSDGRLYCQNLQLRSSSPKSGQ